LSWFPSGRADDAMIAPTPRTDRRVVFFDQAS
jgi:hypothetical protein